jgi:hypothetical protein
MTVQLDTLQLKLDAVAATFVAEFSPLIDLSDDDLERITLALLELAAQLRCFANRKPVNREVTWPVADGLAGDLTSRLNDYPVPA